MISPDSYRRKLLDQKEGRVRPPTPHWVYLVVAVILALTAISLGLIDHTRSN